jgi:hypothetical protein
LRSTLFSSDSQEYYTPLSVLVCVRNLLGIIELDVASCAEANESVGALKFFSKDDNALEQPWASTTIFGNFPGGMTDDNDSLQGLFVKRALDEYVAGRFAQGVFLIKAALSSQWFVPVLSQTFGFVKTPLTFRVPGGQPAPKPSPHGYVLMYLGTNEEAFVRCFSTLCFIPGVNMYGYNK